MPNIAPYKIQQRGGKFVVVNNAGEVKATFDDREKALEYQRALYVNVKGAAKKADRVKFTGKAKPPKTDRSDLAHDAEQAAKKKHPFKKSTAKVMVHTYGGGSYGACATCGLPESAEPHAGPDGDGDADDQTATASQDWAAAKCACGRMFATTDGYQAHFVSLHDAEPDPVENAKNDAQMLLDSAADVKPGDRKKGGMSDGSYPITNQAQANSAWKLRNNSKNHSEAEVVAHIRRRCKALGLSFPGGQDNAACCERISANPWMTDVAYVAHVAIVHEFTI